MSIKPTPRFIKGIPGEAELFLLAEVIEEIKAAIHADIHLELQLKTEPEHHYVYTFSSPKMPRPKTYDDFRFAYVFLLKWRQAVSGKGGVKPTYRTRPMFLPDNRIVWYSF